MYFKKWILRSETEWSYSGAAILFLFFSFCAFYGLRMQRFLRGGEDGLQLIHPWGAMQCAYVYVYIYCDFKNFLFVRCSYIVYYPFAVIVKRYFWTFFIHYWSLRQIECQVLYIRCCWFIYILVNPEGLCTLYCRNFTMVSEWYTRETNPAFFLTFYSQKRMFWSSVPLLLSFCPQAASDLWGSAQIQNFGGRVVVAAWIAAA